MSNLKFNELTKNYIGDFFHVPSNYDLRIAKYTNLHLRRQEGVKTRQVYGSLCSIANGLAFSVPSHGASLAVSAFAARRLYVAIYKLRLIRKELLDRSLQLRPFLKRDWMIPVAVAITAASITWGVDMGLTHLVPTDQLALMPAADPDSMFGGVPSAQLTHHTGEAVSGAVNNTLSQANQSSVMPPTFDSLRLIAEHPGSAAEAFGAGARDQVSALFDQPIIQPLDVVPNPTDPNYIAMQIGFSSGVAAAKDVEQNIAGQLGQLTMQLASDKIDFESLKRRNAQSLACRRLPWSTRVVCQECVMPIERGLFFHSCDGNGLNDEDDDPDDDEYDVCRSCYDVLKNQYLKLQLRPMFFAVPGDSFHPGLNATTLIDLLGPETLLCMACSVDITNGWYYDCWDCRDLGKRWTFCQLCYREGGGCARNKEHRLFSFPRAQVAEFNASTPYQKKIRGGTKETGRASCTKCHANIERGAYYHCSKCDKGNYDLCTRCHASEKHCLNSNHVLTKYYAWKYRRDYDKTPAAEWQCSNPDCLSLPDEERNRGQDGRSGIAEECEGQDYGIVINEKRFSMITITKKESEKESEKEEKKKKKEKKKKQQHDHKAAHGKMQFKFFFSCREPSCHNKEYGLCPPCYFTDLTCPVKEHDMYKCYFVR